MFSSGLRPWGPVLFRVGAWSGPPPRQPGGDGIQRPAVLYQPLTGFNEEIYSVCDVCEGTLMLVVLYMVMVNN